MKRTPTNTDLARIVSEGFASAEKRLDKVESKMQDFHDFMIVQKALETNYKSNGKLDWQKLLEKGLTFLVVTISVVYMLVEFVLKRVTQ